MVANHIKIFFKIKNKDYFSIQKSTIKYGNKIKYSLIP